MTGIKELNTLLSSMEPELVEGDFVFCSVNNTLANIVGLAPLATFQEKEGLTVLLDRASAEQAGLAFEGIFSQITLTVHSSLDAVGLTAIVASQLASYGISANVVAAYYHDHIFVQRKNAAKALEALQTLSDASKEAK